MPCKLRRLCLLGAVVSVAGAVSIASAQPPQGGRGTPAMYDVKTETTIQGTVEKVETIERAEGRGRRGLTGLHLVLKTATGPVDVHVGPASYLAEKKITFASGDAIEILGSRVTVDDDSFVIAKRIVKGEQSWTLRDAAGRPLWAGRGR
jgi:hypothetical protein